MTGASEMSPAVGSQLGCDPVSAPLSPDETELNSGYALARDMYGDDYADYLIAHDVELAAKGVPLKSFPLSLQGNDGE